MRIFSSRHRAAAAGPLPTEALPRAVAAAPPRPLRLAPAVAPEPAPRSFAASIPPLLDVFVRCRHAQVAPARAPIPSVEAGRANLAGYAFFLDADLAGACEVPPGAWRGEPLPGHRFALAIGVFRPRPARAGEPGWEWIAGGEAAAADLRATEIATVLTRYLGTLGHAATAHTRSASDLDRLHVAWAAGLLEPGRDGLGHPFARHGLEVAVVTTDLALPPDRPLAPRSRLRDFALRLRHGLGLGGTRPAWPRLSGEARAWHLGPHPMERIPRRDEPTTLILPDEVARVPERQNFFVRAAAGDLGRKPQREYRRFIAKAPHGLASAEMLARFTGLAEGPAAAEIAPDSADPVRNARAVKALGHFVGAQLTGICEAPAWAWYSHRRDGSPIEPRHRNAIVFVLDQGRETMEGASGDDWISGAQSMRAYLRAALIGDLIAAHIRRLGWPARAYSAAYDELNHVPLLLLAGVGELSRIGEVVLNPFVGPRFKSGVVTTDLPLAADRPIDFGLQDFCAKCTKCARECPVGAIRFGGKTMFNGYEMWKPDVQRCTTYRVTNPRGSACGRCMKTCPYNLEGILAERPFQWLARHVPAARGWLARLDDRFRNGVINPKKKWWLDIEIVDGKPVAPPHGANRRGLQLDARPRADADFAVFPPSQAPGPQQTQALRVDRRAGLRAACTAESPENARARSARR